MFDELGLILESCILCCKNTSQKHVHVICIIGFLHGFLLNLNVNSTYRMF